MYDAVNRGRLEPRRLRRLLAATPLTAACGRRTDRPRGRCERLAVARRTHQAGPAVLPRPGPRPRPQRRPVHPRRALLPPSTPWRADAPGVPSPASAAASSPAYRTPTPPRPPRKRTECCARRSPRLHARNLITRNAASLVEPPHVKQREIRPWSQEGTSTFLEAARPDPLYAASVPALVMQREAFVRTGVAWSETGYIFATRNDRPVEPRNVYRSFTRVAADAGPRVVRLHHERHVVPGAAVRCCFPWSEPHGEPLGAGSCRPVSGCPLTHRSRAVGC